MDNSNGVNQKVLNVILVLFIFLMTGALVYVLFFPRVEIPVQVNPIDNGKNQEACTQEAKICPDGSAVSRTGPNCEFAPCPGGMVGNDKDEHGCIGSAGYTWCEGKQKCLRTWEEACN